MGRRTTGLFDNTSRKIALEGLRSSHVGEGGVWRRGNDKSLPATPTRRLCYSMQPMISDRGQLKYTGRRTAFEFCFHQKHDPCTEIEVLSALAVEVFCFGDVNKASESGGNMMGV